MNLALSDEQVLLREAARGALSRFKTLQEAREALDSGGSPGYRPVADREGGGLAGPADRRGPRRRRAGRVRRDARARRVRARARRGAAARPPARHRDPERRGPRPARRRCWTSWRAESGARPTWRRARPMTSPSSGASTPQAGWSAPALPSAARRGGRGPRERADRVRARRPRRRRAGGRGTARRPRGRLRGGVLRGGRRSRGGAPLRRHPRARARHAAGCARHDPRRPRGARSPRRGTSRRR